jgi:hypothetical protein
MDMMLQMERDATALSGVKVRDDNINLNPKWVKEHCDRMREWRTVIRDLLTQGDPELTVETPIKTRLKALMED